MLTNLASTRPEYPVTVVYRGENGNIWSRLFSDWHRSFIPLAVTSLDDDEEALYLNHYRCDHDGRLAHGDPPSEWSSTWSCMCNDKCPVCNLEIEPYQSDNLEARTVEEIQTEELHNLYEHQIERDGR
jgi:hypothetical protein